MSKRPLCEMMVDVFLKEETMEEVPNPGSKAAIEAGCICPVMDNRHGIGITMTDPRTKEIIQAFWRDATCRLHGTPSMIKTPED